ncbi:MAG: phosphatase PAP2 family protein [Propionibacteriaceae bacterium]
MSALRSAAWSAVGFVVVYALAVRTAAGQHLDESAMNWLAGALGSHRWAELLLHLVSETSVLLLAGALVAAAALFRGGRVALCTAVTVGSVVVAAQVLKWTLIRPSLLTEAIANSFPSGHVAAVAGLGAALVVALPSRLRGLAVGALLPLVGLTGLATVVLAWHRPSDVAGSVLLAVTVASLAIALSGRWTSAARLGQGSGSRQDTEPTTIEASAASIQRQPANSSGESAAPTPIRSPRR